MSETIAVDRPTEEREPRAYARETAIKMPVEQTIEQTASNPPGALKCCWLPANATPGESGLAAHWVRVDDKSA